ncbi:MAG: catalase [Candidatus Pristimantibacillus lignocellulolyticus]|uniref:Catalase n=1 Tax=Candidatus Pristimantibacillus lignocellulolyticus TaxID=2994561 RepID=A0A9J6ZKT7_9BACL|nr:MAG: catalase [Candidatus Pristimantibacillus lignocellulolyticus]
MSNSKDEQLEHYRAHDEGKILTTNEGLKVTDDEFTLKAGVRGPTLIEDFYFRQKMTHFDHERIPERVVHARGFAAHGHFKVYESLARYTKAKFLCDPSITTPVFTRFSTVAGSKGSADTVRDVRGFATKFYTEEGNYDLVGNNIPVFFIQDAIKFPDVIHAVKPEPHNEIPQASSAHDTFWDFVANNQETAHMIMWVMSERALPRSFRMMEGFGVHTFRLINDQGKAHFVKFHWKPLLGRQSQIWKEYQKVAGYDPDFHRRDLWENIDMGNVVEYELGLQIIPEEEEFKFSFDILDATKIWPEEDVPVQIVGKLTLDRNVDNVFAETEQVAFHVGNIVPGIDFTNDPLLQGRLFSYTDTQLIRLGGPNFHELPINRSVCPFHNNFRDGFGRQTINVGQVSYNSNSLFNHTPRPATLAEGGFEHYQEKVEGRVIKDRADSFKDHFSQATMFWNSMSTIEKQHIKDAFTFELSKVKSKSVQQQVVNMFANVSSELVEYVAERIGITYVDKQKQAPEKLNTKASPALSVDQSPKSARTRKVAIVISDMVLSEQLQPVLDALNKDKVQYRFVGERLGNVLDQNNGEWMVQDTFFNTDPCLFDGLIIAGGLEHPQLIKPFILETYQQYKPIASLQQYESILTQLQITDQPGVIQASTAGKKTGSQFVEAVAQQRFWNR